MTQESNYSIAANSYIEAISLPFNNGNALLFNNKGKLNMIITDAGEAIHGWLRASTSKISNQLSGHIENQPKLLAAEVGYYAHTKGSSLVFKTRTTLPEIGARCDQSTKGGITKRLRGTTLFEQGGGQG